ncbi:hypothetical protein C0989_007160, partial [Termitomyces sp. Mn162]
PQLAAEDAEGVPPLQQIPQAEVMVEEFARALAWARGPPTLEWCQNKAPCVFCAWQGEACIFDVPSMGLQHDTSICLLCCASHEKCSILLEWQAACIAAEQGWDKNWVRSQLGEVWKTWVLGEESTGRSVEQVGPPWGGQREGASSVADRGKRRASPPLEVGPSMRPWGHEPMAGPSRFHVYSPTLGVPLGQASSSPEPLPSITEVFLCKQVEVLMAALTAWERELLWVREDQDTVQAEKEVLEWAQNTSVQVAIEQAPEVWGLWECLMQWEVRPRVGVEDWGMAPEDGSLGAELEAAWQREDWLANKAALGHVGILHKLGVGALGSLGRCLHSICIDPGQVGTDVQGLASRVAAGDGEGGEVASRALAA